MRNKEDIAVGMRTWIKYCIARDKVLKDSFKHLFKGIDFPKLVKSLNDTRLLSVDVDVSHEGDKSLTLNYSGNWVAVGVDKYDFYIKDLNRGRTYLLSLTDNFEVVFLLDIDEEDDSNSVVCIAGGIAD